VGIFISFFILGLYFFTGICVAGLELFGGGAIVPVAHVIEGVAPYVLEELVDTLTEYLYNYSYSVADILDNVDNFNLGMAFLQEDVKTRPHLVHVLNNLVHSRDFFLERFPTPETVEANLWFPAHSAPENWFVKLVFNVPYQLNLSFWVSAQVSPSNPNGLWFLLSFYRA